MEFNTQICTTIEQSDRLLELGLNDNTADMFHPAQHIGKDIVRYSDSPKRVQEEHFEIFVDDLPAWSLHRLIAIMPDKIKMMSITMAWWDFHLQIYKTTVSYIGLRGVTAFNQNDNLYDNIIDCIEWLIKDGYFNKKYLKEK